MFFFFLLFNQTLRSAFYLQAEKQQNIPLHDVGLIINQSEINLLVYYQSHSTCGLLRHGGTRQTLQKQVDCHDYSSKAVNGVPSSFYIQYLGVHAF